MLFTEADNAKLYRLNNKIENNTANASEINAAIRLQLKRRESFTYNGGK